MSKVFFSFNPYSDVNLESSTFHRFFSSRTVGGVRVSLYNAITEQESSQLAEFMDEFYNKHMTKVCWTHVSAVFEVYSAYLLRIEASQVCDV